MSCFASHFAACQRILCHLAVNWTDWQHNIIKNAPKIEQQTHVPRRSGGYAISAKFVQRTSIQKAFEYSQGEIWDYGHRSGRRMDSTLLKRILNDVKDIIGHRVTYYLQFGHIPSRKKAWKRGPSKRSSFAANDDQCLERLIAEQPQLYFDEMVTEMKKLTGTTWHRATLWKRMYSRGYSLKVAVHRARQASEVEQAFFYQRLNEFVLDPRQILLIDKTHKSCNASRRRRAWGLRGTETVVPSFFEEDFLQQFTMIGVANIFGSLPEACEIVHRNENLENRGTVDTERFGQFVEQRLVPILGQYTEKEPNSVVIMDNASIHMSDQIEEMISAAGAMLLFTAPYSPHINPIEYFFSTYKKGLARNSK
ncbi:unnamed protein product [Cylindrotheca closterium]|uniref:Tc1-like transposase DDE domain-containing protein n=1 Tax=Cylindrotheca closterium TaxID=2856 RepID=A0AAD2CJA3_9STRA|nr:unnamed protein product [Cylindrotheca closterium]